MMLALWSWGDEVDCVLGLERVRSPGGLGGACL